MRLRLPDVWVLGCLAAAITALTAAFRGHIEVAAYSMLTAVVCDGAYRATCDGAARFGQELSEVVRLVAFGAAPSVILYVAMLPHQGAWISTLGAAPLLVAAVVRMALKASRPPEVLGRSTGLPRALSALLSVAACGSWGFEASRGVAAAAVAVGVAALNLLPLTFDRLLARPVPATRAVFIALAILAAGVGFALGHGFDVVFALGACAALVTIRRPIARPVAQGGRA